LFGFAVTIVGLGAIGAIYQAVATQRDALRYPPPGELVDAGGYRLHMLVAGRDKAGPTVILDTGLGLPSTYMSRLQEQVAPFARVVAYDRPGIGWSDVPPAGGTQDSLSTANALHAALVDAGISGPYVLVGHSAGGLNMLVFASTYPQETAGIVLVDSTHPDQFLRYPPEQANGQRQVKQISILFEWGARLGVMRLVNGPHLLDADGLAADQKAALQAYFASPRFGRGMRSEAEAFEGLSFPQVRAIKNLGDMPMEVLTAGMTAEQVPVQVELHQEYTHLSTNSLHRIVAGASHANLVTRSEFLPAVTAAVRQVFEAARDEESH
jgi:pimeloyl-ACP methyl ester carboxylesterase